MKFVIDGDEHELPGVDTLDIGESIILYDYSGLTIDQIEDLEGLSPGLLAALMHIAIARSDSSLRRKDIEAAVKGSNLLEILASVAEEEEEADHPVSAPESNGSSSVSEASSGADSASDSESLPGVESQPPTGTPPSATTAMLASGISSG